MRHSVSAFAISIALSLTAGAAFAEGPEAEVMHWWVSAGESAAIKQVADAYTAAGGVWKDNAIAGGEVAIANIISRITGGDAPTAAQMPLGKQIDDLVASGLKGLPASALWAMALLSKTELAEADCGMLCL